MKFRYTLLLITALTVGCQPPNPKNENNDIKTKTNKPAVAVESKKITRTGMSRHISTTALTSGIMESHIVSLSQGAIRSVNFKLGDYVKKGQLLLSVDSDVQKTAKEQAEAALETAELNMEIAEKLHKSENISRIEYVNAKSQLTSARAAVSQTAKLYRDCFIKAPFSGHIASKSQGLEKGSLLAAGAVVARIVNISKLKAQFQLGEMEIPLVEKGMEVELNIPATGNGAITGRITAVSPASDPQSGAFPIEVEFENREEKIKAGMLANITIKSAKQDKALVVPFSALFEKDNKKALFIEEKGKVAVRFVKTGRIRGNLVEVLSGVGENENLITSGTTVLSGGDPVKATSTGNTGGPI